MTIFSPRASFMAHHVGDFTTSATWAAICNELCFRVSEFYPERFAPATMLPQSPGVDPATCVPELTRCVEEYRAVALNLNPDPCRRPLDLPAAYRPLLYPVYEKMVEYDIPAMIHVSTSVNPAFHTTGAHYLNADTTAFMQLVQGDLFADFPTLRLVIPHSAAPSPTTGPLPGLAMALGKPPLEDTSRATLRPTCVYHQHRHRPPAGLVPRNVLFASEMIGAVRASTRARPPLRRHPPLCRNAGLSADRWPTSRSATPRGLSARRPADPAGPERPASRHGTARAGS